MSLVFILIPGSSYFTTDPYVLTEYKLRDLYKNIILKLCC